MHSESLEYARCVRDVCEIKRNSLIDMHIIILQMAFEGLQFDFEIHSESLECARCVRDKI